MKSGWPKLVCPWPIRAPSQIVGQRLGPGRVEPELAEGRERPLLGERDSGQGRLRFATPPESLREHERPGEQAQGQPEMILELEARDVVLVVIDVGVEPDRREMLLRPLVGRLEGQRLVARQDQGIARAQIEALVVADVRAAPRERSRPGHRVGVFGVDLEAVDADRQHGPRAQKLHRGRGVENLAEIGADGGGAVELLAVAERAVHRERPVQLPVSQRRRQAVVDAQRARHRVPGRFQHEQRSPRRGPPRDRRTQGEPGNVRRQEQPALDLGERHMALADQRGEPSLNESALFLGDPFDIDALNEAVDHDKPQRSPILELLRRHRDANQHIAMSGVGLLDRVGGGEDFGDGHPPASDAGGNGGGLGPKFGKAPVDDNVRNGYGEVRSIRRRSETRRTGYGYRPRRTGRRRQRAGRHPRGRNDLPARQARRHRERPSQKQERRPPHSKRSLGRPSRNWRLAGVQEPAPDGLP